MTEGRDYPEGIGFNPMEKELRSIAGGGGLTPEMIEAALNCATVTLGSTAAFLLGVETGGRVCLGQKGLSKKLIDLSIEAVRKELEKLKDQDE